MAVDIALAVLPIIADYTIVPIKTHVCYALYCKTNLQDLKKEMGKLRSNRDDLLPMVDEQRRNGKTIHESVTKWLQEVEAIIREMERQLEDDENRRKKKCFIGLCPDFITRYKLGKNAKKELATVANKLEQRPRFDSIAHHAAPVAMGSIIPNIKGYEVMGSRNKILKEIMNALKVADGRIMIGVYGMGGIGKTTLVKVVAREASEQQLFDKVAIATVTHNPDIMRIQQEIGDQLGITFKDKVGQWGRAYQLRDWLKEQKKILIVLDDLWGRLDLEAVGISLQDEQKDCKLLLTSREFDVLSTEMDVQYNFSVDVLEKEETWDLFKKTAGGNVEDPEVQPIAVKIATRCGGLPVAIVSIAKALKDKRLPYWKDAWLQLQKPSPVNFTGRVSGEVYRAIELSYQHLESVELKSTLLLCSRMGYNASIDDLLKYNMGLGTFSYVATTEEARNKASSLVHELKKSCLLLDGNTSNQFSIHDVVHDVAISIAFRDHAVFVKGIDEVQMEGHGSDSQREYKEIWLHGDRINQIFEDVNCKKVEIFIMKSEDPYLEIPGEIFGGMKKLKVIGLTNVSFSSMPSSFYLLNNLHSLCIHQSSLGEIEIVGQLKQLEVLSFVESTLKHLPEAIGKLKNLKLLDLTDCSELEVIAPKVISNLSLLQELHLGNSFHHWDIGENNASLMELEHLSHLIILDIHVPDSNFISKDLFSTNLERYRIFIGDIWDWHDTYNETSRTLKLKFRESKDHLKPGIPMLLKRTEDLYLLEVKGVKNVVCELDNEGFPRLKHLHLHNSLDIQYVIDTMDEIFSIDPLFPKLESLFLYNLSSIKNIYHGEFVARSFEMLQILKVESCVELKNLFFLSTRGGVEVTQCRNMDAEGIENSTTDVLMEFPRLRSICLKDLSNLRSFCSIESLESGDIISEEESIHLFDEKILFPKLEDLQLESIPNIGRVWRDQLSATTASIQNLQRLEVVYCRRLEYIFSLPMVKNLVQLRHLTVGKCHSVKEIIETEALEVEEETKKMLFPKLEDIVLEALPKLRRFCTGCLIECPLLKTLSICNCPKFETFISDCESREVIDDEDGEVKLEVEKCQSAKQSLFNEKVAFPSLARLHIVGVQNLEKIWNNQLELGPAGTGSPFYDQLRSVSVGGCGKLVNIFPSMWLRRFQRLEELSINGCNSLEEVFEGSSTMLEGSSSSSSVSSFQLRDLHLSFLPKLKHIWNKDLQETLLNFHNLHTVHVYYCDGLKNLFPFSIATDSLQQLEKLEILYCKGLEEMVAKTESGDGEAEAEVALRFEFPQLASLTLERLQEFRNFYRGKHSWECPRLKSFRVIDCPNVKVFGSKSLNIKGLLGSQHDQQQQPLFLVEKVIRSLEELSLDGKGTSTATSFLWQPHLLEAAQYSYSKLKVLNLQNFERESDCPVPFSFLRRLPNLETLAVQYCSLKKLFSYEGFVEEEQTQRVQFKNLVLKQVGDITREQEHRLFSLLHHLKTLRVHLCSSLVNLVPFSTSFQDLSTLEVVSCHGLSNLITSSIAKSFVQLVKLIISYGDGMVEMVAKEEVETEDDDEIVFNKLEYLELYSLRNLQSFCSANYTFKFPSLKEVIVEECPKMLFFSLKAPSTPKLRGVCWQRYPKTKKCWHGNLNATITEMLLKSKELLVDGANSNADSVLWHHDLLPVPPHFYSSFEVLKLKNFKRKSYPFSFGLVKKLHKVTTLSVEDSSLQRLFLFEGFDDEERSRILARFRNLILNGVDDMWKLWQQDHQLVPVLHNLVTLRVKSCDYLVTLTPSSASFQNLSTLEVSCCNELSNLIASSTAKSSFFQLVKLTISQCCKMTEIVAKDKVGDGILDEGEIVFHKLEYLELKDLENLTSFSPANYTFKFPSLKQVIVEECFKMLIFSLKVPSTPKLQGVCWQRNPMIKVCWQDDLNATITKMSDGVAQFKQPSTPILPTLTCETSQVDGNGSTNVLERRVFEDLQATRTPETSKDPTPGVATIFENKETRIEVVSTESKITQITSSSQDFDEPSNDKENLTLVQNSSTFIDSDTQIHGPLPKDPHASEKDESSLDNVVLAVSFEQSNTIPLSPGTSVERVSLSTSASSSNRTSSQELTVACADSSCPTSVFQRQVYEDLHSTRTIETSKDLPAVVASIIKKKETLVLTESKNTRTASSFQDFNAASNEKEDPTQGEKPSTSMGYKPHISLLVQKDSQTIEKPSPDNVISGVSLQQQRDTSPLSSGTSIEQVSMSTSASSTHRTSSQELTFRNAASSDTPTETLESYGASSKLHWASIELTKKLVMKSPAEVAASSDYFLLMSSLKNLKNCASLNSQEQEIVRFYLENFPSLVTNNPFDEQKIDCTNSIKISIEDHKKELAELDISNKDLTIEIGRLSAAKDELNKQLRAIQEEEDLLQAKKKILLVQIDSREGELEIEMDALLEAERQKRETKDRASSVNENWDKLRNLSA